MNKKIILLFVIVFSIISYAEVFGVIFNSTGTGDNSFNSLVYKGINNFIARNRNFSYITYIHSENNLNYYIDKFVDNGINKIFLVGSQYSSLIENISQQNKYRNTNFYIIDANDISKSENISSLIFNEFYVSFRAGVSAATDFEKIAFIGIENIPAIERFRKGFESGLKTVNKKIDYYKFYVNLEENNQDEILSIGKKIFDTYDIVFTVAGVFNQTFEKAAILRGKKIIITDRHLNYRDSKAIYGSVAKNMDYATEDFLYQNLVQKRNRDIISGINSPYLKWDESSSVSLDAQLKSRLEYFLFFKMIK
ncbi:MAG: BMP family ABC transporter substrate-binding protein [Candidatus Muiribacteriota bacterium]